MRARIRLKFGTLKGLIKANINTNFGRIRSKVCHAYRVNPLEESLENCRPANLGDRKTLRLGLDLQNGLLYYYYRQVAGPTPIQWAGRPPLPCNTYAHAHLHMGINIAYKTCCASLIYAWNS